MTVAEAMQRANALHGSGDLPAAESLYRAVAQAAPQFSDAWRWLGVVLARQGRLDDARACLARAVALAPEVAGALSDLANVLMLLRRPGEALAYYDRALALAPDGVDALVGRGTALHELARHAEALAAHDRALAQDAGNARAMCNRGTTLAALSRHDDAIAAFTRALAAAPDFVEARVGRAAALARLGRYDEAIPDLERAQELAPGTRFASGALLHARRYCCDWSAFEDDAQRVLREVKAGQCAITPFAFLDVTDDPRDQHACARIWLRETCLLPPATIAAAARAAPERVRIAYLSTDFCEHALAYLMAGVFEAHDRSRFDVTAVALRPAPRDAMRVRLERAFERFIDAGERTDREIVDLLRAMEIDIAVDLNGFTADSRTGIFAQRAAPVQASYLGYPGTMGAPFIDYLIADAYVIPPAARAHYAEHVVCLPDTFQANDRARRGGATPTRAEVELPADGFVFAAFNSAHKLSPRMFDVWTRLLACRADSVLWLTAGTPLIEANLRREAHARGIASGRLVFAPRVRYPAHLARLPLADLFLDTLPFNAGATASDALWMGLPVLTCSGEAFAARMAGSLLHAIGVPELATATLAAYEALGADLASDPARLAGLRRRIAEHRDTHPLFDTDRFCRSLEAAFERMSERHRNGEPPGPITIPRAR